MSSNPLFAGLRFIREPAPFSIVIFGVTGDLTRKKLIPALFSLFLRGNISRFRIIGFARRPWGQEGFRKEARSMIDADQRFSGVGEEVKTAFLGQLDYIQSAFEDPRGYEQIEEKSAGLPGRLYYLSTPPSSYDPIVENLGRAGLAKSSSGLPRVVVEKPFGRDLASARDLNGLLARWFQESQIYRIDHYLGKETVQNLMVLRFGNGIFEPVWNNHFIDHVQITVAERIGVGTRGNYYESIGTLRDMVQNHMFQLLSLTTMEPPSNLEPDTIRSEKVKILKALQPIGHREAGTMTVRAQYAQGIMDGQEVPGYREEDGVSPVSRTETYVALKLFIDTWRWAGVPFYLRSGKRLSRKTSEISVHFKEPPHALFAPAGVGTGSNTLIIKIQPDEGVTFTMNSKIPGNTTDMRPVNMDFSYGSSFGVSSPEAYERLILDALLGDSTLYTRRDEIETSWAFITRILRGWEDDHRPPAVYRAGSSGPEEAKLLLSRDGRRWRKL